MMVPVIFDLDGVLANSVAFERQVMHYVIRCLAQSRGVGIRSARQVWVNALISNRSNAYWHDYALHCHALGLGDVWRAAHRQAKPRLKQFCGVAASLDVARRTGPCWIASDATEWVVRFKLRAIGLASYFDELFTVDRCGNNKSSQDYWRKVREHLAAPDGPVIFIENRPDRLVSAAHALPGCFGIVVKAPDHPASIGFASSRPALNSSRMVQTTHAGLPRCLDAVSRAIHRKGPDKCR